MRPGVLRGFAMAVVLVGLVSSLHGCAGKALMRSESAEAPVLDGPFRGRWWNYYERGRAYQKRGEFDRAEQDFRTAILSRREDALWPRTYGMHFIPEYFPHRELGVSLYYQDDLEASVEHLRSSLDQQFSARAAYYFKQAQQRRVASMGDTTPPSLEVRIDQKGLSESQVTFAAVARDDGFVSAVEVNGASIDIRVIDPEVPFSCPVTLAPGANLVRVRIVDLAGNEFADDITLEADLDGPAVSFDTPVAVPGVITGVVFDRSGVAALTVGGTEARLVQQEEGLYRFEIAVRSPSTPLDFRCRDALGNTTDGLVPLPDDKGDQPAPLALASNDPAHGTMVMAASVVKSEPLRIRLDNIPEGAAYYQQEIIVALNARSKAPIERLTLLGEEVDVVPARNDVYITRRVRLDPGDNALEAAVVDIEGNQAADARSVRLEESELDNMKNKLAVAMMAKSIPADDLTRGVIDGLHALRDSNVGASNNGETLQGRFSVVSRENLEAVLREQELSAELASTERALLLNKLIPFEVLLQIQANLDNGTLEIVADGVSSEKGVYVTGRVDVAGDEKDADELLEQLVVRILQEFPRARGEVIAWDNPEVTSTLTAGQGTRAHSKCLVYRLAEILHDGQVLGSKPEIIAEGFITSTGSKFSTADLFKLTGEGELKELKLGAGDYVILK